MSKKGAVKTGGSAGRSKAANQSRAAYMAAHNIHRTTYRDPITNAIRAIGTIPGTPGRVKG